MLLMGFKIDIEIGWLIMENLRISSFTLQSKSKLKVDNKQRSSLKVSIEAW